MFSSSGVNILNFANVIFEAKKSEIVLYNLKLVATHFL